MSNFKRKVNIVESTTPPTNMYDWWYDTNNDVLKRPSGGGYEIIGESSSNTGGEDEPLASSLIEGVSETDLYVYLRASGDRAMVNLSADFARMSSSQYWTLQFDGVKNIFQYKNGLPTANDIVSLFREIQVSSTLQDGHIEDHLYVLPTCIDSLGNDFFVPCVAWETSLNMACIVPSAADITGLKYDEYDSPLTLYLGCPKVVECNIESIIDSSGDTVYVRPVYVPSTLLSEYIATPAWNAIDKMGILEPMDNSSTLDDIIYQLFGEI